MLGAAIYLSWGAPWWVPFPQGARKLLLATMLRCTTDTRKRRQCSQRVLAAAGSAVQATDAPARSKGT